MTSLTIKGSSVETNLFLDQMDGITILSIIPIYVESYILYYTKFKIFFTLFFFFFLWACGVGHLVCGSGLNKYTSCAREHERGIPHLYSFTVSGGSRGGTRGLAGAMTISEAYLSLG